MPNAVFVPRSAEQEEADRRVDGAERAIQDNGKRARHPAPPVVLGAPAKDVDVQQNTARGSIMTAIL